MQFLVVDARKGTPHQQFEVQANTPIEAGQKAMGMALHRAGKLAALACRVYWSDAGAKNMVRLYRKASEIERSL